MMKRNSDLKADIEKIKKLQALQQKATDKLDKITEKAGGKTTRKKTAAKAAPKKKSASRKKTKAKKPSFWQRVFGNGDSKTKKRKKK